MYKYIELVNESRKFKIAADLSFLSIAIIRKLNLSGSEIKPSHRENILPKLIKDYCEIFQDEKHKRLDLIEERFLKAEYVPGLFNQLERKVDEERWNLLTSLRTNEKKILIIAALIVLFIDYFFSFLRLIWNIFFYYFGFDKIIYRVKIKIAREFESCYRSELNHCNSKIKSGSRFIYNLVFKPIDYFFLDIRFFVEEKIDELKGKVSCK